MAPELCGALHDLAVPEAGPLMLAKSVEDVKEGFFLVTCYVVFKKVGQVAKEFQIDSHEFVVGEKPCNIIIGVGVDGLLRDWELVSWGAASGLGQSLL